MARSLKVSVGQASVKGDHGVNGDFYGLAIPQNEVLFRTKGIIAALADGISSSKTGHLASRIAVTGFLTDYYSTPPTWSVKRSGERVLQALNGWLWSETRRARDPEGGYVCTFSAAILKGDKAHLFHVGDSRIYHLRGKGIEPLTEDHRFQDALSRALGMARAVEIDYLEVPLLVGDLFVLVTDGVHQHLPLRLLAEIVRSEGSLQAAAERVVGEAIRRGSRDDATVQIVRIDELPELGALDLELAELPPPELRPGVELDGYRIVQPLHLGYRSHVYLAVERATGKKVVLKTLSAERRGDWIWRERLLLEEWLASRFDHPHLVKAHRPNRERSALYAAFEFIDGETLAQWLRRHPRPPWPRVREIVVQIGKALQALHRREVVHMDLRPENLLLDRTGTVKLIDFGSVQIASLTELSQGESGPELGAPYSAPELFLGEWGSPQSDLYALGVITYQLLTGRFPYGTSVPKCRTRGEQRHLRYLPTGRQDLPVWIEEAIRKAVDPDPRRRHQEVAEFLHDLYHPNPSFPKSGPPLAGGGSVRFWKTVSLLLSLILLLVLVLRE